MTLPTNEKLRGWPGPDREARRELAKLTATFLNGIGIALIAVGGLTPIVAFLFEPNHNPSGLVLATISPISLVLGVIVHLGARRVLRTGYEQ